MGKQVDNGRAYEYAIANSLRAQIGCPIMKGKKLCLARDAFEKKVGPILKKRFVAAAEETAKFLLKQDDRLKSGTSIIMQEDVAGAKGDVRDIIVKCGDSTIGISAKHNHEALKHSRLSPRIDFGRKWAGEEYSVSQQYWKNVNPVFDDLKRRKDLNEKFSDIHNLHGIVLLPVMTAFKEEMQKLSRKDKFASNLFHYIVGNQDFYKSVCRKDNVTIESVNINGTLKWGSKWRFPSGIRNISKIPDKSDSISVTFEDGWVIIFRIHNARTRVEVSLKFDIGFEAISNKVSRTEIPFPK